MRSIVGYVRTPAKPIAAQPTTSAATPTARHHANARNRRVATNQTASGHRKSFATVVTAAAGPATAALLRRLHTRAVPSNRNDESAPSASELTTAADIAATP